MKGSGSSRKNVREGKPENIWEDWRHHGEGEEDHEHEHEKHEEE